MYLRCIFRELLSYHKCFICQKKFLFITSSLLQKLAKAKVATPQIPVWDYLPPVNICLFLHQSCLHQSVSVVGGVGLPAMSVEDDPRRNGCGVLRWSSPAAALLVTWVGREGYLHTHLAEGRTHTPAQDHSKWILFFVSFCCNFFVEVRRKKKCWICSTFVAGWVQAVVSNYSTCHVGSQEETLWQFDSKVHRSSFEWRPHCQ